MRHAPVQHCENVWRRRGRRTFHPVAYFGRWLRIVEILEGSLLVVDKEGLVVVERIDQCDDLLSHLTSLVQWIETEYADAEALTSAYLAGDDRAVTVAQLSTLAAGFYPGTYRYLADLVDELEQTEAAE